MTDLWGVTKAGTRGPALPTPAERKLYRGDAFVLVDAEGTERLHVWDGQQWHDATQEAPVFQIEIKTE